MPTILTRLDERDRGTPPETWHEIVTSFPPVPGPVRPVLDDRLRQEASAVVWSYGTRGEPLYAPRNIEASLRDSPSLATAAGEHLVPPLTPGHPEPLRSPA
ncbi:hypothetical protein SAMN05216499_13055 [Actinacidiphila paucisporea]|uniref:Uncharacterized protein n=1 Tax=Actinacidiphila paucisporea TaxID=310782 RepID=A0A1M7Q905_9ACTN|nr:hypothetical protein SAMN05216499_13055 [Actinacidiphila paucisporea]